MKKIISLFLVPALLAAVFTVTFHALSVSDEGVISAKEGLAAAAEELGEEIETQRIYFQMPNGNRGGTADEDVSVHRTVTDPETGDITDEYDEIVIKAGEKAPSWYSDYNIVDGKHYAGAYWWGGTANTDGAWVGYRMEIEDYDQGIYYVDVPTDVVIMIFNNGVDGGQDDSQPIYYEAAQTVNTNIEGALEDEFDTLPMGSPDEDYFDGCILIIDPNQVSINEFSNMQTCGANWYVYYGNGCYGEYFDGCDEYVSPEENCVNPDHFKDGVHVGYQPDEKPTQPETQAPTQPATQKPTQPETQAPTQPATQKPTQPATVAPTEPAVTGLRGDADGNGEVDIVDVTVIQRIVIKKNIATAAQKILADVDGNGAIESTDATLIQRWLVDLDDGYNIAKAV